MADNGNAGYARYSAINAKNQCRRWAWQTYRETMIGFKNHYAKIGIAIHNLLQEYGEYCIKERQSTDFAFFDSIKNAHLAGLPEDAMSDARALAERIKDNTMWDEYFDREVYIERRFYIDNEFNPTDKDSGNVFLSGAIDLVCIDGNTAYAEDYKTVRTIYSQKYMEESLQRKFYSALIFAHFPEVEEVSFVFNFCRYNYKSEPITMTRDDLDAAHEIIRGELADMNTLMEEEEAPEASPGSHCILCDAPGNCPAYKNAFNIDGEVTKENALDLYRQYRIGQFKLGILEDMLKGWIEVNGPIINKDEQYGPKESDDVKYKDIPKLIECLESHGVLRGAIYDAITISKTNVDKLLTKFKVSKKGREEIRKLARIGKKTRFVAEKVKYVDEAQPRVDEEMEFDPYL